MKKQNWIIIGIYVATMIGVQFIGIALLLTIPQLQTGSGNEIFSTLITLITYMSLFLIFVVGFRKYFFEQFKEFGKHWVHSLITIIIGFVLFYLISSIAQSIITILGETGTSENQESLNEIGSGMLFSQISLIVFAVVFAPVVEEFVFRKAIFGIFPNVPDIFLIIISGLLFGLIHVSTGDFVFLITYGSLGMMLAYMYSASNKRILVPIAVHFLINLLATLTTM